MKTSVTALTGIVACGGQSSRMGEDKSGLIYHGKPQREYLYELLSTLCKDVFISCNKKQEKTIPLNYQYILDASSYSDIGPMSAVLSAFGKFPGSSLLVMGCDYPLAGREQLEQLIDARQPGMDAVCFADPEKRILEPLLAIYENSAREKILRKFDQKKYSLRHALGELSSVQVVPRTFDFLKSIDDRSGYEMVLAGLEKNKIALQQEQD